MLYYNQSVQISALIVYRFSVFLFSVGRTLRQRRAGDQEMLEAELLVDSSVSHSLAIKINNKDTDLQKQ